MKIPGAEVPVFYCVAHHRKLTWLPLPGWWIHDDPWRSSGNPSDPRGCWAMWDAVAPVAITKKETLSWLAGR